MKVSISNNNKPSPIISEGLAIGLIGAGAAIGGAGISAAAGAARNKRQQKFRKEEIAILEANADENATIAYNRQRELANEAYQRELEQWERENAYNDPSAVAARYRAAGINPRAAFNGVSGAGISGGSPSMSFPSVAPASASVGGTPSLAVPDTSALRGLADIPLQIAQAKKLKSEAELDEQKAKSEQYDREVIQPSVVALNESLNNLNVAKAEAQEIENTFTASLRQLDVSLKNLTLEQVQAGIQKTWSDIRSNEAYQKLTEAQKKAVDAQVDESVARVARMQVENKLTLAQIELANSKTALQDQQAMTEAIEQKNKEKQIELAEKQIELIGTQMGLNQTQINDLKQRFKLDKLKFVAQTGKEFFDRMFSMQNFGKEIISVILGNKK